MNALRLRYQTLEFATTDIHLCTLRDRNQFYDPDGEAEKLGISSATWPLFGIAWPSGIVLANVMQEYDIANKRILEVGCGIGLSSILLNKRNADITATDYHPSASEFLERNRKLNDLEPINFVRADWSEATNGLGLFDVIIGSDVLYDEFSIKDLASFIERHSKLCCEVILVDPARGNKGKLDKLMHSLGFISKHKSIENLQYLESSFKGHLLTYSRS